MTSPFFLLPFYFFLVCLQTASIIEYCGYDSSEAATLWFMLSCFMTRDLGCYAETIKTFLGNNKTVFWRDGYMKKKSKSKTETQSNYEVKKSKSTVNVPVQKKKETKPKSKVETETILLPTWPVKVPVRLPKGKKVKKP